MKKLKLAFWLIFIGFFAVLIYQNLEFFSARNRLEIDLGIYYRQTPEMSNGAIIASFVGVSVLIMLIFYLSSRFENFRAKKTIRSLTQTLDESTEMIAGLKNELEMRKQGPAIPAVEETSGAEEISDSRADAEKDTDEVTSA